MFQGKGLRISGSNKPEFVDNRSSRYILVYTMVEHLGNWVNKNKLQILEGKQDICCKVRMEMDRTDLQVLNSLDNSLKILQFK